MNLIYIDESGNSGKNLADPQQPIFVLAALVVSEEKWIEIEIDLESSIPNCLGSDFPTHEEIHTTDIRNGSGVFRGVSIEKRMNLRDKWFVQQNHPTYQKKERPGENPGSSKDGHTGR